MKIKSSFRKFSVDLWDAINKPGGTSPRKEILINIDYVVADSTPVKSVAEIDHVWMGIIMEVRGTRSV